MQHLSLPAAAAPLPASATGASGSLSNNSDVCQNRGGLRSLCRGGRPCHTYTISTPIGVHQRST
eukprot:4929704-Alexandrium_andersonii.AAC.1